MTLNIKYTNQSNLCRFEPQGKELVTDEAVKIELATAFKENRCFPFFADPSLFDSIKAGTPPGSIGKPSEPENLKLIQIKNEIIDNISAKDSTLKNNLEKDARLSSRLIQAIYHVHRAIAELEHPDLPKRRFVLVKERHGIPSISGEPGKGAVWAHVGQGPRWTDIPTIYVGINTLDALTEEQKRGEAALFETFKSILLIEERAIETGYTHLEEIPAETIEKLNLLFDEVLRLSTYIEAGLAEVVTYRRVAPFTKQNREAHLKMLDQRMPVDMLNFDYPVCLKAIQSLERLARRYKERDDLASLTEVTRLLVSASGHDLHE
ncbi:MAG TPA: hypothetical protein VMX75_04540, partial [Spirochaetia bacterium]|nr:hypothetical protein [Spirochaetia bacterium]